MEDFFTGIKMNRAFNLSIKDRLHHAFFTESNLQHHPVQFQQKIFVIIFHSTSVEKHESLQYYNLGVYKTYRWVTMESDPGGK